MYATDGILLFFQVNLCTCKPFHVQLLDMEADNDNTDPFQRIGLATALILVRLRNQARINEQSHEEDQSNESDKASDEARRAKLTFIGNKRRDGIAASQVNQRVGRERAG